MMTLASTAIGACSCVRCVSNRVRDVGFIVLDLVPNVGASGGCMCRDERFGSLRKRHHGHPIPAVM